MFHDVMCWDRIGKRSNRDMLTFSDVNPGKERKKQLKCSLKCIYMYHICFYMYNPQLSSGNCMLIPTSVFL